MHEPHYIIVIKEWRFKIASFANSNITFDTIDNDVCVTSWPFTMKLYPFLKCFFNLFLLRNSQSLQNHIYPPLVSIQIHFQTSHIHEIPYDKWEILLLITDHPFKTTKFFFQTTAFSIIHCQIHWDFLLTWSSDSEVTRNIIF